MSNANSSNAIPFRSAEKNTFALHYWKQKLQGINFQAYLRPESEWDFAGASSVKSFTTIVDSAIRTQLEQVAPTRPAQHMILMASLALLVQRYHSVNEVLLLTPAYLQSKSPSKFSPSYIVWQDDETLQTFIQRLAAEWGANARYSIASFQEIGLATSPEAPLPVTALILEELQASESFEHCPGALVFKWNPGGKISICAIEHLYSQVWFERLCQHYLYILQLVLANIRSSTTTLGMLDTAHLPQLPQPKMLPELNWNLLGQTVLADFQQQVERQKQEICISNAQCKLSYQELADQATQIACFLVAEYQVEKGDRIGLILDRDMMLIPCILGVLKAGGVFVPVDPAYPSQRKTSIIEDAQIKLLISRTALLDGVDLFDRTWVDLDQLGDKMLQPEAKLKLPELSGTDLAYIIYTSGSTGKPKGVMIEHRALLNYIKWAAKTYCLQAKERFLLHSSISFDLTITSIFTPLLAGHEIVLQPDDIQDSELEVFFGATAYSIIKLTPSHLKLLRHLNPAAVNNCSDLHTLIVGGEALDHQLAADVFALFGSKVRIFNEYGPTEATVGCMIYTFYPDDPYRSVPIGRAIEHMQVLVLDNKLQLLPAGVTGDLYIAGIGLARGYWQQAQLSAERFIQSPFGKLYCSGDLASCLEDGTLIYKGRRDDQVKINGHRIELGEVEYFMKLTPGVVEVFVQVIEHQGERLLAAYYTAERSISTEVFRKFLSGKLPQYAIPYHCIHLSALPLTANGKLDRQKLPNVLEAKNADLVAPSNPIEEKLLAIWRNILQLDEKSCGVTQSFFELGGNSIRAIYLVHNIAEHFLVQLAVRDIFNHYSIQAQARLIEQCSGTPAQIKISPVQKQSHYTTSPAQQRLYFQQTLKPAFTGYNICSVLWGAIDEDKLLEALTKLVIRHESLRTSFQLVNGELVQLIHEKPRVVLERLAYPFDFELEVVVRQFIRPFDLHSEVLFRVGLWPNPLGKSILIFDIHHIIADGASSNILVQDFMALYQGENLSALALQYKDYAAWLGTQSAVYEQQKKFWMNQLAGKAPQLGLPVLRDKETVEGYTAQVIHTCVEKDVYKQSKEAIQAAGVSDFMYFLGIYYVLVYKLTGDTDMVVGTDIMGRNMPELNVMVGSFVNILPLRFQINPACSFNDLLQQIKALVLDAFDHQEFQFDEMLNLIHKEDRGLKNPLIEVHFSMYNTFEQKPALEKLTFQLLEVNRPLQTQYPLKIEIKDREEAWIIAFVFNDSIYEKATIALFSDYYYNLLLAVLQHPEFPLKALE